ncbi:MAG: hypothetical protein EXR59_00575 [Dehalococcoidia bacterium]|nr:hypothetical protein [Dehalococcoidia bacterium]
MSFGNLFSVLGFLFPVAVIVLIAVIIISAARHRSAEDDEPDEGIGSLRRFFYYGLALVALSVAASGLTVLLAVILDAIFGDDVIVSNDRGRLALGLSLTVVGAPIWGFIWMQLQRVVREQPVEARSFGRKFYFYFVMGVTALIAAVSLVLVLRWTMNTRDFSAFSLALPVVMIGIWVLHWKVQSVDPPGRGLALFVRPLYVYSTSIYSLGMFSTGIGLVLFRYLIDAHDSTFESTLVGIGGMDFWPRQVREGFAFAIVSCTWWILHWFVFAKSDREPGLRQVYLNIVTVLGGTITVSTALIFLVFRVIEWVFGAPDGEAALGHFRVIPGVIAGLVVGGALWGYHAAVIHAEASERRGWYFSARRAYEYLAAGVGLGILAGGLVTVTGVALGVILPEGANVVNSDSWWKSPLALGISLVVVGGLLWGMFWSRLQHAVGEHPEEERERLSRRVFIYGVFCIAALIALVDLSGLLFVFLRDLMGGNLNVETFQETKWFIAALFTAGLISVYFGLLLRGGSRIQKVYDAAQPTPASLVLRKRIIVLGGPEGREFARRLEGIIGQPVIFWLALEAEVSTTSLQPDFAVLAERIAKTPGESVLIVLDNRAIRIMPYRLG